MYIPLSSNCLEWGLLPSLVTRQNMLLCVVLVLWLTKLLYWFHIHIVVIFVRAWLMIIDSWVFPILHELHVEKFKIKKAVDIFVGLVTCVHIVVCINWTNHLFRSSQAEPCFYHKGVSCFVRFFLFFSFLSGAYKMERILELLLLACFKSLVFVFVTLPLIKSLAFTSSLRTYLQFTRWASPPTLQFLSRQLFLFWYPSLSKPFTEIPGAILLHSPL